MRKTNKHRRLEQNKYRPHSNHLNDLLKEATYIVFDIETTGGNPEKNGITEICALKYQSGKVVDRFLSLVNPQIPIPPIVRKMTGITDRMVKDAPLIDEVMPKFVDFIGDDVLVSHNTIGDLKFIRHYSSHAAGKTLANLFLCTHLLAERLIPESPKKTLQGVGQFLEVTMDAKLHRAEADAILSLEVFRKLMGKLEERGIETLREALKLQADYESMVRIGWEVDAGQLKEVPEQPGVFYLYGSKGELLFLSSAVNLAREVRKLKLFDKLPKPILDKVFRAKTIKWHPCKDPIEAAILEAGERDKHPHVMNPSLWHNRYLTWGMLHRTRGGYHASLGSVDPKAAAVFGPFPSDTEKGKFLKLLSVNTGQKAGKNAIPLARQDYATLRYFLLGKELQNGRGFFVHLKRWLAKWRGLNAELLADLQRFDKFFGLKTLDWFTGTFKITPPDGDEIFYKVKRGVIDSGNRDGYLISVLSWWASGRGARVKFER
jgi:DNA polymerase III epsilon subunit family exonuclease